MTQPHSAGKLIVFEGPDGVGRSTIAGGVADALKATGYPCVLFSFPGSDAGTLGRLVYDVHHAPLRYGVRELTPAALQALHIAAHLDAIERVLIPTLRSGHHVLLDRFWWSTLVYGMVDGANRVVLRHMIDAERAQWDGVAPTAVVLLHRPGPIDRDHDPIHWTALRRAYDELAVRERRRYPVFVVENTRPPDQTQADIVDQLLPRLRTGEGPRAGSVPPAAGSQLQMNVAGIERLAGPTILSRAVRPRPTVVFDSFWCFAAERQEIFFKRLAQVPPPWTADPVLATYKFTNAYRASDRVSQYLIQRVIYRDDLPASPAEVFFRIILFKLFNKIETWEALERESSPLTYADYSFDRYDAVLTALMRSERAIYSAAYIMPSGRSSSSGIAIKHRTHLRLLEQMMADALSARIVEAPSMQRGFELLRAYPMIGDFLAYQFIVDINYSEITNFSEMEFVVPGPGARDGIRKCFADLGGFSEADIIRLTAEEQEQEFAGHGLAFRSLFSRPLQLIDCQSLFCEIDKYARVAFPEVAGRTGRTRIKQRYRLVGSPIRYWYPPKWGINAAVAGYQDLHDEVADDTA